MTRSALVPLFLVLLSSACSNERIDDGARYGPFTQVKTFFTSAFVAETSKGVVLADEGYNMKGKQVAAHLEARGLGLNDAAQVLVTHGQRDHVRSLAAHPRAADKTHQRIVGPMPQTGGAHVGVGERS